MNNENIKPDFLDEIFNFLKNIVGGCILLYSLYFIVVHMLLRL